MNDPALPSATFSGYLESQLNGLKESVLILAKLCRNLSLDPRWVNDLQQLSSQTSAPADLPPRPVEPGEALEIASQVRASLNLLITAGYVNSRDVDGPIYRMRSTLDDLERELGERLRGRFSARMYGLYVIIDPEVTKGRDPVTVAAGALTGGARALQLRDKLREKGSILPLARSLRELCAEHDAILIINDHPDLAAIVDADGLHVGQGDLPVAEARQILNPRQIIGRSNHTLDEVLQSQAQGVDHIAVGAIYPTTTKASIRGRAPTGPEFVRTVKEVAKVPVVAIGGINQENVEPVVRAGADSICVTGAVGLAADPEDASRRLVKRILEAGGKA